MKKSLADLLEDGGDVKLKAIGICGAWVPLSPPVVLQRGDSLWLEVRSEHGSVGARYDLTTADVVETADPTSGEPK